VGEVVPAGWRRTSPASGYFDVTLSAGGSVTGRNCGNTQKAMLAGSVFNDSNGNGIKDAGEAGVGNVRIFLDADKDGIWDSTERSLLTDASGKYTFKDLAAGTYRVRQVLPASWRRTAPSAGYFDLTLAAGASMTSGKDFADTQKVLISGSVFGDANRDKLKSTGEAGLSGWKVFIDADKDGVLDAGERFATTDASGYWSLKDLVAGTFVVRVVQQSGYTRTTPTTGNFTFTLGAGQAKTGLLFGEKKNG
jgi:hypothetical protein